MDNDSLIFEGIIRKLNIDNPCDKEAQNKADTGYKALISCITGLPPKQFVLLSTLLGILLIDDIDPKDQLILGKFINNISNTIYTPHVDTGDFVIVVNADKVVLTGKKLDQKLYRRHSQYPGGLKEVTYRNLFRKKPTMPVYLAVKGMLPKNSLGRKMLKKLKVYAGPDHNNQAQKPQVYEF